MATPKAQDTAGKILKTAAALFDKRGFYNVTLKEIADSSKLNSALISYHFGSKKELYQAVLQQQITALLKLQDKIQALKEPPLKRLSSYLSSIMQMQLDNKQHVKLIYQELLTPSGFATAFVTEGLDMVHQFTISLLKEAMEQKEIFLSVGAGQAAFTLEGLTVLAFLSRKQLQHLYPEKNKTEKEILEELINSYLAPLKGSKEDK